MGRKKANISLPGKQKQNNPLKDHKRTRWLRLASPPRELVRLEEEVTEPGFGCSTNPTPCRLQDSVNSMTWRRRKAKVGVSRLSRGEGRARSLLCRPALSARELMPEMPNPVSTAERQEKCSVKSLGGGSPLSVARGLRGTLGGQLQQLHPVRGCAGPYTVCTEGRAALQMELQFCRRRARALEGRPPGA